LFELPFMVKMPRLYSLWFGIPLAAIVISTAPLNGETSACKAVAPHELSPAEKAYSDGFYPKAEQLFTQALAEKPQDPRLAARLIDTLLHQDKVAQAVEQLNAAVTANPNSAAVLTAKAEIQMRQGLPWLATQSLDAAAAADPCYARVHLVRSEIFHIDSMFASERSELQKAYEMDLTDPDILMAWSHVMPAAQEVEGTKQALAKMNNIDADTRQKAETAVHSMMPLLHETSQTCKVLPTVPSATVPLLPSVTDGKRINGFRVEVNFPKGSAKLQIDTAASGLYITKELADLNGFTRAAGAPMGTAQADTVQIGPLEFHDCMVGVSDIPFPGKVDGFIGTDILSSYLITIDGHNQKLKLDPLPAETGLLPGDRPKTGELADYEPVYHRRQYLLVPVTLDNKVKKLFAIDTGMRMSAMNLETAHAASDTKMNFTNSVQTKSGPPVQVYRDPFDFQFAGISSTEPTGSILQFEPSGIDHNTNMEVGGMLGFDLLGRLTMHLDYRDGLVKLETPEAAQLAAKEKSPETGAKEAEGPMCPTYAGEEIPLNQTLELKVTGTLDSAHLKPGKQIYAQVVHGLIYPGCTLDKDAIVYGRVTAASSTRNPDGAELGLEFDRGDCEGGKKVLPLHLIALLPPPDNDPKALHGAVPSEVAGGARDISVTTAETDAYDAELSEGGQPHTVHPGVVVKMPKMKLDPMGGPGCSAMITSTTRNVQLGTGAELILALSSVKTASAAH
jgi:tetratricopeptide (TPR) repeat protein